LENGAGAVKSLLRLALLFFAASAAAVLAHVAIDIAGDYVLAHDAYDALEHGSRWTMSLAALGAAGAALWAVLRAALAEARGSNGSLRDVLRAAAPRSRIGYFAMVAIVAVPILAGMSAGDAMVAHKDVDDLGDLFGGSIALAGALLTLCASLVSFCTIAVVRALTRYHRVLLRAVIAFVRVARAFEAATARFCARWEAVRPRAFSGLGRCTSGNRAPPLHA
jgi:hypothetical protein